MLTLDIIFFFQTLPNFHLLFLLFLQNYFCTKSIFLLQNQSFNEYIDNSFLTNFESYS